MKKDIPDGLIGEGIVFKVRAEYVSFYSKMKYYMLGAGATGGIIYYINTVKKSKEKGRLNIGVPVEY